jgi:hypothetical protein
MRSHGSIVRSTMLAAAAGVAACATPALAQTTITLFGQEYSVERLNYSDAIRVPRNNPLQTPVPFNESEGIQWVGDNKVLMSADDIADFATNVADNWVIEVQLTEVDCQITGIAGFRTILAQSPAVVGYDLNPTGITVNPTGTGFASGGGVVVAFGDGRLYGYTTQAPGAGTQLAFPIGSVCASPATCAIDVALRNSNLEDVAFAPVGPNGAFFTINQDQPTVERWDALTGEFVSEFFAGGAIPNVIPLSAAKGLTYVADSPFLPASLRRPEGILMVSFDDNFPGLQAFDLSGNLIGEEALLEGAVITGAPRLDIAGCPGNIQIESLTYDAATGRIFLNNQGSGSLCNFLWVLTPTSYSCSTCPVCPADFDQDGGVTGADVEAFFLAFESGDACGDTDLDGGVTGADVEAFFLAFEAGGC